MQTDTLTPQTTRDDLLWLIGQKEISLLQLARQTQALLAENARLKAENIRLVAKEAGENDGANDRQASGETISAVTS